MQLENLTKEQFIRDFKDTLHQEQLIKVAKATPTEIFTALAGLIRKYYTNTWIERNHALSDNQEKIAYYFLIFNTLLTVIYSDKRKLEILLKLPNLARQDSKQTFQNLYLQNCQNSQLYYNTIRVILLFRLLDAFSIISAKQNLGAK